jgi:signal transduction histidine kinase
MKQVDLNELLGRTLSRSQVPGGVEIVRQGGEGLPRITADPDQLEVVFRNLVQNAVEAMPGGGRLEVSSRRAGDTSVSVTVKDAGRGIPEKNLGRLFDPFFTTKPRGIGLGLPVARTLVENHGGTISVESQSGKGSTFTVTLPVNRMGGENQ